ncbi:cob(I)yrinic acid a,c-diamide adenosyltransferase [Lichenicola sp.]|uniref:cob(I)yrinic acid a,c-diamide adenosyltransferase n=1 Tax=Lichenicola sp. TaxID=2804529 RepID=UPI003B000D94
MIRIDRVATRTGDDGTTSLGDGSRTSKDGLRIEALGAVDEANAEVGVLRTLLHADDSVSAFLGRIQNGLFDIGGDLCLPGEAGDRFRIDGRLLASLDDAVAEMSANQPPLDSFVLPGGSAGAAQAHVVRTVVRRAERRVVALAAAEPVNPFVLRTLNRLSDYAFVLSRHLNDDGRSDVLWTRASS